MRDWTANPRAVAQYHHLMRKSPRDRRETCLGLLGMNPPTDFRHAIEAALEAADDDLFGVSEHDHHGPIGDSLGDLLGLGEEG